MSTEQKAIVELIIASEPESMTTQQRMRLVSMVAAYSGVSVREVSIISVTPTNSSKVMLALPEDAARRLIDGFERGDPKLASFFEDFSLLEIRIPDQEDTETRQIMRSRMSWSGPRFVGEVAVLDVHGPLSPGEGTLTLTEACSKLVQSGHTKILLNLAELGGIGSTGIGELVSCYTTIRKAGGHMKLANLHGDVRDVLKLTRLSNFFEFVGEEEAIDTFKPGETNR
jgi:anti-sigma B factor antagonist